MKLNDLIYAGEYEYVSSPDAMELTVNGVCSSSLDASEGFVFVCLRGVHTDGTMYMADAYRRGAAVCVCSSPPALLSGNYVIVKNARRTLAFMLSRFWQDAWKSMDIYALTGTNGKTSTAMFLREIFISAGYVTGYIGTLKSYINRERFYLGAADDEKMSTMTTPDPEQLYKIIYGMRERGVQKLIIEASSHALKLDKLAPLHFSSSAFLNFSSDHLDFHLNTGDYLLSKCRIFSMSDKVIINADDPMCAAAARAFAAHSASYGIENDGADYVGKNVFYSLTDGVLYDLCYGEKSIQICSSVIGEFTVYNSLAAASIALSEGIDGQYVQKGIKALERIDGRLERLDLAGGFDISVFIDYAHTENAMEKLLMSVSQSKMAGQRIVTLFGCGGDRDREKRAPMGRVASLYSDLVIVTEDNSRSEDPDAIIEDIMRGIDTQKEYIIIKNRKKAIQYAIKNAKIGDIILLVGKGHEQYEITKEGKVPFSEKEIVYESLAQRKNGGHK